jgi:hypothetical protein
LCRTGEEDPERFGIFDMHGLWFVGGNVVRDLLSLRKVELLPWDGWGLMPEYAQQKFSQEYLDTMDRIAALTLAPDESFTEVRSLVDTDERLRPAPDWRP